MSSEELNGWILIAGAMIQIGVDAVAQIKAIFAREGRTEEELNQVLAAIQEESRRRRAISAAIAFGA